MPHFDPDKMYRTDAPELEVLGTRGALAVKRCEGKGPPFIKCGNIILYDGSDLNAWLDQHRVEPGASNP